MSEARERSLFQQLRDMLRIVGASPGGWVGTTVGVSAFLALLDMLGVAALIPLMDLISGSDADSGLLGMIAGIMGTTDPATLIPVVAGGIAVLFVGKSVLALLFRWWLFGRTTRVAADLATDLMRRYVLAPYMAHRSRRLSEVYRNINASTAQAASVLMAVVGSCTDLVMLVGIGVILALASPWVMLTVIVFFAGFVGGLQWLLRRRQSHVGEEFAAAALEAWQFLMPALDGFREARLTSSGAMFISGFHRARLREARASREMGILSEIPRYALEIAFVIAILAIAGYFFTQDAAMAITVLSLFAAAAVRALPTLTRVSVSLGTIRQGRVGLRIVLGAIDELEGQGSHDESPRDVVRYSGDIVLKDVGFRYPDAAGHVFEHLSLAIQQTQTTAFVGSSGAGKSTLLDLILGLQDPTTGSITSGGRSTAEDRAGWYATLGVVPQEVFLTNDSVIANIAFGVDPAEIDESHVREVVAQAQLTDLIADMPDGLHTVVGERGVRLSGGQRQRLGLARALYRRPSVLVLDEATSALDNATEHQITQTLASLKGQLTIIIVAHRLSTVQSADHLVFLDDGQIKAQGTFEQLREHSVDFARLVSLGDLH